MELNCSQNCYCCYLCYYCYSSFPHFESIDDCIHSVMMLVVVVEATMSIVVHFHWKEFAEEEYVMDVPVVKRNL